MDWREDNKEVNHDDMLDSIRFAMKQPIRIIDSNTPPLWAQPMGKPPYPIKPIEISTPQITIFDPLFKALEAIGAILGKLAQDCITVLAPTWPPMREAYIARAIPEWGERNKLLKVKTLPAPREEIE